MIHGVDTSVLAATELTAHSRHTASRRLLHRLDQAGRSRDATLFTRNLIDFRRVPGLRVEDWAP